MVPGLLGVEHYSITVPDHGAATAFLVGELGARVLRRADFSAADGSDMAGRFDAHPEAAAHLVTLDLHGTVLEVFEYDAPDLLPTAPRNCDAGGHHIGFRVADVAAAAEHLRQVDGVRVLGEPEYGDAPGGGRRGWVYFIAPWGLQMEIAEERR